MPCLGLRVSPENHWLVRPQHQLCPSLPPLPRIHTLLQAFPLVWDTFLPCSLPGNPAYICHQHKSLCPAGLIRSPPPSLGMNEPIWPHDTLEKLLSTPPCGQAARMAAHGLASLATLQTVRSSGLHALLAPLQAPWCPAWSLILCGLPWLFSG